MSLHEQCINDELFHQDHPDLITSDIHLGDILSRANIGRKGTMRELQFKSKPCLILQLRADVFLFNFPALFELALPKKKIRDERRKKKLRTIKMESEDPVESLVPSDDTSAPPMSIINSLPDKPSTPLTNIKEE